MKKFIFLAIIFIVFSFIIVEYKSNLLNSNENDIVFQEEDLEEYRAIFLSYIDYSKLLKNKSSEEMKMNIDNVISNLKNEKYNVLILQVRSFSDAIYKSNIFPSSSTVVLEEGNELKFDILDYFIEKAHVENIKLFAWINPYRVRNTTDINTISEDNPAYKWLNTNNISVIEDKGIFYNPASIDVQNLIIEGVKEVANYNVDGILFDDYFYPSNDIDKINYEEYIKEEYVSLNDYHLKMVNNLIKRVYSTIKNKNKKILFGISPEGNIDNNYTRNYADVKTWLKEDGYIDFIMPQIYYGFLNGVIPFNDAIDEWNELIENDSILIPALALYKVGEIDTYAKEGKNEWLENDDILKRQIEYSRNLSKYKGFSIYRYDYYFNYDSYNDTILKEINNIKSIVK